MQTWWQAGLDRLNTLSAEAAAAELRTCCASRAWAEELAAGRPYPNLTALFAAADAASRRMSWDDITEALAAHPRIGERAAGADREAGWSRQEQSGAQAAAAATREALVEGNQEYERRFGHVFLIRAAGRSGEEMLAALRERLGNDETTERRVVADQLREIAQLRLKRLVGGAPAEAVRP